MALVPCPECSRQISTAAAACPSCGYPMAAAAKSEHPLAQKSPEPVRASEETLWEGRPATALLLGQVFRTVGLLIVLAIGGLAVERYVLPGLPDPEPLASEILRYVLGFFALLALLPLVRAVVRIKSIRWRFTNQRLVVESGFISKTQDNLDVRTIDDTKYHQSMIERLLGFGDVVVISKDKTNPTLRMAGVKEPRQVQELIRSTAYRVSQGQLFMREA